LKDENIDVPKNIEIANDEKHLFDWLD